MAFAINETAGSKPRISYRDYESVFRKTFIATVEFNITALNTDTDFDLVTEIESMTDTDIKRALEHISVNHDSILSYHIEESPRQADAAAKEGHIYDPSTLTWTFAGDGTTPTSLNMRLIVRMKDDIRPVPFSE